MQFSQTGYHAFGNLISPISSQEFQLLVKAKFQYYGEKYYCKTLRQGGFEKVAWINFVDKGIGDTVLYILVLCSHTKYLTLKIVC